MKTAASAAALALLAAPASASAALGYLVAESATVVYCHDSLFECTSGCSASDEICHFPTGGTRGVCAPDGAVFCVGNGEGTCPTGTDPLPLTGVAVTVCIESGRALCRPDYPDLDCFTSPDDAALVSWARGDCDGDGIANGLEVAEGLCAPPPRLGIAEGDDCAEVDPCATNDDCSGGEACAPVGPAAHAYCLPSDRAPLFCCDIDDVVEGSIVGCPRADACPDPTDRTTPHQLCGSRGVCADLSFLDRQRCFYETDGVTRAADIAAGDCDGDGVDNETERAQGDRNECVYDAPAADAGDVAPPDGGPAADGGAPPSPPDAGDVAFDAGAEVEGAPVPPQFGGGGGCRCRASPGDAGGGGLFAVLALGLFLRRRQAS